MWQTTLVTRDVIALHYIEKWQILTIFDLKLYSLSCCMTNSIESKQHMFLAGLFRPVKRVG